jgi:hypothetical protein
MQKQRDCPLQVGSMLESLHDSWPTLQVPRSGETTQRPPWQVPRPLAHDPLFGVWTQVPAWQEMARHSVLSPQSGWWSQTPPEAL